MGRYFHVTSSTNRESIRTNGLDWKLMGAARGIAGSTSPEQDGCFLIDETGIDWFVHMNNTGGTVDVWAVDGVDPDDLVGSPEGYSYVPATVDAAMLTLWRSDCPPQPW